MAEGFGLMAVVSLAAVAGQVLLFAAVIRVVEVRRFRQLIRQLQAVTPQQAAQLPDGSWAKLSGTLVGRALPTVVDQPTLIADTAAVGRRRTHTSDWRPAGGGGRAARRTPRPGGQQVRTVAHRSTLVSDAIGVADPQYAVRVVPSPAMHVGPLPGPQLLGRDGDRPRLPGETVRDLGVQQRLRHGDPATVVGKVSVTPDGVQLRAPLLVYAGSDDDARTALVVRMVLPAAAFLLWAVIWLLIASGSPAVSLLSAGSSAAVAAVWHKVRTGQLTLLRRPVRSTPFLPVRVVPTGPA